MTFGKKPSQINERVFKSERQAFAERFVEKTGLEPALTLR